METVQEAETGGPAALEDVSRPSWSIGKAFMNAARSRKAQEAVSLLLTFGCAAGMFAGFLTDQRELGLFGMTGMTMFFLPFLKSVPAQDLSEQKAGRGRCSGPASRPAVPSPER